MPTPKNPASGMTPAQPTQSSPSARPLFIIPKAPSKDRVIGIIVAAVAVIIVLGTFGGNTMRQHSMGVSGSAMMGGMPSIAPMYYEDKVMATRGYDGSVSSDAYYSTEGGYDEGGGIAVDSMMIAPNIYPVPPMPPEPSPDAPAATPEIPADKKIVKNGNLSLLVADTNQAVQHANAVAIASGGFVESSSFNQYSGDKLSGSMTLRVPADQFDAAMHELKQIAIRVETEYSNAQDVSAQYVDLEAQLKNFKVEEEQYEKIMAKAEKIGDVLSVASRLADVRGRIERTQGQINLLSRRAAMSTITLTLIPEASPSQESSDWRPLTVLKEGAQRVVAELITFANAIILLVLWLPLLAIELAFWVLIAWLLWKLARVLYRHIKACLPERSTGV